MGWGRQEPCQKKRIIAKIPNEHIINIADKQGKCCRQAWICVYVENSNKWYYCTGFHNCVILT